MTRPAGRRGHPARPGGVHPPERGSLGARIRAARLVPYQAVIGASEAARGDVALRLRDGRRLDPQPAGDVLSRIRALAGDHRVDLWATERYWLCKDPE